MTRTVARTALTALSASVLALVAAPALAAPTPTAPLDCGADVYTVSGFGRGQVLHVEGTTTRFVVTRAERNGVVVFDAPGQADRTDLVTCTTTPPGSPATFTFQGFLTPRA